MTTKEWSAYQQAIFKDVSENRQGHTIVEANAGSGKTSVLIESFKYVPKNKNIIAFAFNKKIQVELEQKAPHYVTTKTFHSFGYAAVKNKFKNVKIDNNKAFTIVQSLLDRDNKKNYNLIFNIIKTIDFCKSFLIDTPRKIEDIIYNFDIDICDLDKDIFINIVVKSLAKCKSTTSSIDYNDMCWMVFVHNLNVPNFQYVFIDETQDVAKSQLVIAQKACDKNNGRIIALLDFKQQLYSWRGTDISIIKAIQNEPTTKTFTLPISYRCPKKIIDLVKPWVPNMLPAPGAKDGEIYSISINELYSKAKPGCFILSRTNAPLIRICFNFIKMNIKCGILGRDISDNLTTLIKSSKKKTVDQFLAWLNKWKSKEIEKLKKKNIKTDNLIDKYECLINLAEGCETTQDILNKINSIFSDNNDDNAIILATVHASKGLERNEVFVLRWTFRQWINENTINNQDDNEELNISYVCISRSKEKLYLVNKF